MKDLATEVLFTRVSLTKNLKSSYHIEKVRLLIFKDLLFLLSIGQKLTPSPEVSVAVLLNVRHQNVYFLICRVLQLIFSLHLF